jgi:2-C-methyl-D-erythritol 4-phosphate cytidylyltransferase
MSIKLPDQQRYFCIIPAAGTGTRAGGSIPKQYWLIDGKTILEHTIQQFLAISDLAQIIVALHPSDQHFSDLPLAHHPKISTVQGGTTRVDSVRSALGKLAEHDPKDWVFIHDAVRPNIKPHAIAQLAHDLVDDPIGGSLAIAPRDTIKEINAESRVKQTLPREHLRLIQTPQLFRLGLLNAVYQDCAAQIHFTDDAGLVEAAGFSPRLIQGDATNLKLTYPEDCLILSLFMQHPEVNHD